MAVTEAMENYLETILILSYEKDGVHAVDISDYLEYSRPTVSIVLRQLREKGLIYVDENSHVILTDEGRAIAENIYEKHRLLTRTFIYIGVDEETALKDACKVEHDLSDKTFECIKKCLEGMI